jgi:hypothetical protein
MPRELIEPLEDNKGTSGAAKRGNSTSRQVDVGYRYQPAGARKPKPSSRRARVTAATGAPIASQARCSVSRCLSAVGKRRDRRRTGALVAYQDEAT